MATIEHMAMCTKNNRRLARFYDFIFGMKEVWNEFQNSPYSFYIGDGYFQLNCLQIRPGSSYVKIVDGREVLPEVGIHHIGFRVGNMKDVEKRLAELDPPIRLEGSPQDGRYEEKRFTDPDGNLFELAQGSWDAGASKDALPLVRHVSLASPDPERLAGFYKTVLDMREVDATKSDAAGVQAVFLSDGLLNFAIVRDPGFPKSGLRSLGFRVESIARTRELIKTSPPFLYPGEPPIEIVPAPSWNPYRVFCLKDPDGNIVDISEEGWPA